LVHALGLLHPLEVKRRIEPIRTCYAVETERPWSYGQQHFSEGENMDPAVLAEIDELRQMKAGALRVKYREVFGEESRSSNRQFLFRRIAWRLQANVEGDLSERARQRALEIADDADLRICAPEGFFIHSGQESPAKPIPRTGPPRDTRLPHPGALITRQFQDRRIVVKVLEKGFEYQSHRYRSLSAIAREITGTRWNGLIFFGLAERSNG
jgi:hypothetical protein